MGQTLTIGRLARAASVNVETVRYYQRRGLLPQPDRPVASVRRYEIGDLDRLRFIRRAQAVGFTLAEIESLLRLRERISCRATRALAREKLATVETRLRELQRLRHELKAWIAGCDQNVDDQCCPTLDALEVADVRSV